MIREKSSADCKAWCRDYVDQIGRIKELESAMQEFVDCAVMTGEDGREFQSIFKGLLKLQNQEAK